MSHLPPDHISVTNVRPAYAASRFRGVSEGELEAIGLPLAVMEDDEAAVSGEATYAHMELMESRVDLGPFLVDAAERHTITSLGIVGLSCKTVATVGDALSCHQRFQHLTNRTARYVPEFESDHLTFTEQRGGPPSRGSLVISDYTMLVAVHLLRVIAGVDVPVIAVRSRRAHIDPAERATLEGFLGAAISTGADRAALVIEGQTLGMPVATADPELAAYFTQVLARAARFDADESPLLAAARLAIQDALATGTPTGVEIARRLGMSQRTLQRKLLAEGVRFADLLADTRMSLAKGYLADRDLSLAEVAYLLGYREETSFFRSFRRWTGVTPSAWRSQEA